MECHKFSCEEVEFVLANSPDAVENMQRFKKSKNRLNVK